ncbi:MULTISPECIES: FMN-binding protein [unclassified Oleiphilus]|jgi:transcriptional regulator of nitric oxide reductase|nr:MULTISPECIES: FMN-binding protein [unclassified Oleiphilus]KZZ31866.1 hypothetical protein A3756_21045 [Oleiphilus sp. HI0086]KZZ38960.1 hypothetical protein A3756_00985 [Oleiphilus sp. HI0086]
MKYPFDGTSFSLRNLYLLVSCLFICLIGSPAFSAGLDITPIKAPLPFIQEAFPNASSISEKTGDPQIKTIFQDEQVIGYAFETDDVARIPAYSGEPVNTLVTLDTQGTIISANVLEHHEPILLVGIPEQDLCDFTDQYQGLKVNTKVKVGTGTEENTEYLDGVSGATVTVMVMNMGIIRAANEVAIAHGIIEASEFASQAAATINQEVYQPSDWQTLTGNGAIRRFHLNNSKVDDAFMATEAADQAAPLEEKEDTFVDLYYTQLNIPTVGRSLLGDGEYEWMMEQLKPGEHVIGLLGNGYSFKGSGYVRGGIFDRIVIHQGKNEFSFRDTEQYRINDLYAAGTPHFKEMSLFIVSEHHKFDPGQPWQVELLIRRQTGPIEGVFTSFKPEYAALEEFLIRPEPPEI